MKAIKVASAGIAVLGISMILVGCSGINLGGDSPDVSKTGSGVSSEQRTESGSSTKGGHKGQRPDMKSGSGRMAPPGGSGAMNPPPSDGSGAMQPPPGGSGAMQPPSDNNGAASDTSSEE